MTTPNGYEAHNPIAPRLSMDGVTWLPMRVIPPGDPRFIEWVAKVKRERDELKPWTLVSLCGEVPLVATRRTFWWRLVTMWHNVGRRRERRRLAKAILARQFELQARMAAGLGLDADKRQ